MMGMFDYLRCDYLKETRDREFQTKSMNCPCLDHYTITETGELRDSGGILDSYIGEVRFYDEKGEYSAYFVSGKVMSFNKVHNG